MTKERRDSFNRQTPGIGADVTLRDLRKTNLAAARTKADSIVALCGEFAGVSQGLYVFLFTNDSDRPVYDDNKKRKIVIYPRGMSIKPGKFEKGFAVRVGNYHKHLHRERRRNVPISVLGECFVRGYWLDLSAVAPWVRSPARVFERYWTEAVNAFLAANELLAKPPVKQLARAEWRYLRRTNWTAPTEATFGAYLREVSTGIFEMARVGTLPSPSPQSEAARGHARVESRPIQP
jgi:hypothetical protein